MVDAPFLQEQDVPAPDYARVAQAIDYLTRNWRAQPDLDGAAAALGLSPFQFQKLFTRWAGLSPKEFVQALTIDHARGLLRAGASVLDAAGESGLSGPSRPHDLFVTHDALSPGEYKARGAGLTLSYGWGASPFGTALLVWSARGVTALGFADARGREAALDEAKARLPAARYEPNAAEAARRLHDIFGAPPVPLRLHLIGTAFDLRVWDQVLQIPNGAAATYGQIAHGLANPTAVRAVGAAVGRNPVAFVVPCHRVLGARGALCGYRWGLTRKKAILGWERGQRLQPCAGEPKSSLAVTAPRASSR